MRPNARALAPALLVGLSSAATAWGADSASPPPSPTREEIQAWLESHSVQADVARAEGPQEGLPLPPRHHGWLLESGIGALGQLGELRHVSPLAPRYFLRGGYEFSDWFLLFAEGDVAFANTQYAPSPPETRGYALYGFGGGLRFTLQLLDQMGAYLQGSVGLTRVTEDVLATYGYSNTTTLSLYFGGTLGVQFYLPSPHLRLLVEGGLRNTPNGLDRTASQDAPLSWMAGPAIAYAF